MRAAWVLVVLVLAGCGDSDVYTLYRNSPIDQTMRIHVSTFDSADGDKYNSENCNLGRDLFARQPGVTVRYWCEKGHFRK